MKTTIWKWRNRLLPVAATVLAIVMLAIGGRVAAQSDVTTAPQSGTVESGLFQLDYRIEGVGDPAIVIGFPPTAGPSPSPNW